MSIELFNIQLGVNMQRNDVSATNTDVDEEIATLKSVADLSTISFGKSDTAHLSDLNSCMFYHFDRSVYRGLSSVKGANELALLAKQVLVWLWWWDHFLFKSNQKYGVFFT